MLSVYYDYQILRSQKYGGISRYFFELASRLPLLGAKVRTVCVHSVNYYFGEQLGVHSMGGKNSQRLFSLLNQYRSYFELRKNYSIIHPTYYNPYLLGKYKGKLVVTVHDMTHEKYRDSYAKNDRVTIPRKDRIIHAADRIIAISENTRRDLLHYYPDVDPAKISVIYHGASMHKPDRPSGKFTLMAGQKYILFVGARGGYKNFTRFIEAVRRILDKRKELHVFCAGGGAFSDEEQGLFGEYAGRIHQAGLSDEELTEAYAGAECFVFPSEYEGFGIPILEAFACGCPVVCSDASCFPEVAGESAEYFDPLNPEDMAAKIQAVIEDEAVRKKLIASGSERLKIFDWDKTATETLKCYKEAIEND